MPSKELIFSRFHYHVEEYREARIPYVVYGDNPEAGLVVGVHGDEAVSIGAVAHVVKKNLHLFPSFYFILQGSPTAVVLRQETNAWGVNVNRAFFDDAVDPETRALMAIMRRFPVKKVMTCHEDEDNLPFYLYHQGKADERIQLDVLRKHMTDIGIGLHSGIDVPLEQDPALGFMFDRGYNHTLSRPDDGTMEYWLLNRGLAQTVYTVELPRDAPRAQKIAAYEGIFDAIPMN